MSDDVKGCVYIATNTVNNKKYIGKTKSCLEKRIWQHMNAAQRGSKHLFHCAIRKYGKDAFGWVELFQSSNDAELLKVEIELIKEIKTKVPNGYNLTNGGEGLAGLEFSLEHRAKIRAAHLGRIRGPQTKEHTAKVVAHHIGKKHSEETKRKMSLSQKGIKRSSESALQGWITRRKNGNDKATSVFIRALNLARRGTTRGPMSEEQKIKISITKRAKRQKEREAIENDKHRLVA